MLDLLNPTSEEVAAVRTELRGVIHMARLAGKYVGGQGLYHGPRLCLIGAVVCHLVPESQEKYHARTEPGPRGDNLGNRLENGFECWRQPTNAWEALGLELRTECDTYNRRNGK